MNKVIAGMIFSGLFFISGSAFSSAESFSNLMTKGDNAFSRFDHHTAEDCYRQALELQPDNYEAAWKNARALVDLGDMTKNDDQRRGLYLKAENSARLAVADQTNGSKGHLFLSIAIGKVALDEGPKERVRLSKEVKFEVDKALALDPQDDTAWHVLGRWNRRLATLSWIEKKFADIFLGGVPKDASVERAAECFEKAIELNPGHILHHLELALTLEELNDREGALREYVKVLALPIQEPKDRQSKLTAGEHREKLL